MRKFWVVALPIVTAALCISIIVGWLFYPRAMQITVHYSKPTLYIHDPALDYLDEEAAKVRLAENLYLRAELVQQRESREPQLLFFFEYTRKGHEVLALDIARSLLGSPEHTASGSYVACVDGRLVICLDEAAAPGCTPWDTMGNSYIHVDETTLCPEVSSSLECVDYADAPPDYRTQALGGKYFFVLTWVPEDYCLTFGDHVLTGTELQSALLQLPYGYAREVN